MSAVRNRYNIVLTALVAVLSSSKLAYCVPKLEAFLIFYLDHLKESPFW